MVDIVNASVVLKDKDGNTGIVRGLTSDDITLIQNTIQGHKDLKGRVDVVIDNNGAFLSTTEATDAVLGTVKKASSADITAGTSGKVVDAAQMKAAIDDVKEDLSKVYKYKGAVQTYAELPATNVNNGDVYDVMTETTVGGKTYPAGTNFAAVVDESTSTITWDPLGGDVADYARKTGDNTFTGTNSFSGTVNVPTQTQGDNSTKAASTSYVDTAVGDAIDAIVNYSATEPTVASLDNNTATFYQGGNLFTQPV